MYVHFARPPSAAAVRVAPNPSQKYEDVDIHEVIVSTAASALICSPKPTSSIVHQQCCFQSHVSLDRHVGDPPSLLRHPFSCHGALVSLAPRVARLVQHGGRCAFLLLLVIFDFILLYCETCSSTNSPVVTSPDYVFAGEKMLEKKAGALPRILYVTFPLHTTAVGSAETRGD